MSSPAFSETPEYINAERFETALAFLKSEQFSVILTACAHRIRYLEDEVNKAPTDTFWAEKLAITRTAYACGLKAIGMATGGGFK